MLEVDKEKVKLSVGENQESKMKELQ